MKTILVPTDFSGCANRAVTAANLIAVRTGASLVLFHSLEIPEQTEVNDEEDVLKELIESRENADLLLAQKYEFSKGVRVETVVRKGDVAQAILDYTNEYPVDMIVMGSHGKKGVFELFVGSNAQKVVRMAHLPVLVVKEDFPLPIRKVVYASEYNQEDEVVFKKFIDFIRPFSPEISLLYIKDSELFDMTYTLAVETMERFAAHAAPMKCDIHINREYRVSDGIITFAEKNRADLIVLSNHYRKPFKRMLMGSKVEAVVNHSDIGVLSFDFPEEVEAKPAVSAEKEAEPKYYFS